MPSSNRFVLFLALAVIALLLHRTEQAADNFYGSCPGKCVTPSEFNSSLIANSFCSLTLKEYIDYNQTISFCISSNASDSSATYSWDEYFQFGDNQARLAYVDSNFQMGLFQDSGCFNAAKRYICQHFFPLCESSGEKRQVYNLCYSSCENYYKSCNSKELVDFRCVAADNNINRQYNGVWKKFDNGAVFCTGQAFSNQADSLLLGSLMALLLLLL